MAGLPQVERVGVRALLEGGGSFFGGVSLPAAVPAAGVFDHYPRNAGLAFDPGLDLPAEHRVVHQPLLLTRGGDDAGTPEVPEDLDQGAPVPGTSVPTGPDGLGGVEVQQRQLLEGRAHAHGPAGVQAVLPDLRHEAGHGHGLHGVGQHVDGLTLVDGHVLPRRLEYGLEQFRFFRQQVLREEDPVCRQPQAQGHGDERVVRARVSGADDGVANDMRGQGELR